jgi:hypothetical protein
VYQVEVEEGLVDLEWGQGEEFDSKHVRGGIGRGLWFSRNGERECRLVY